MTDLHLNFSAQPHERPGDDDAREARHQVLATLLGAYADRELPPETASQIDAHLLGCARCRREVDLHTSMHARLSREPLQTASAAFRERIIQELARTQQAEVVPTAGAVVAAPSWRTPSEPSADERLRSQASSIIEAGLHCPVSWSPVAQLVERSAVNLQPRRETGE